MDTLKVIIEMDDGDEIAGSVDTDDFFFTTIGKNQDEVINSIRTQIANFIKNEGAGNPVWESANADELNFAVEYDLTQLFSIFEALKISSVAELAGINPALMRQYASGVKSASKQQATKIEIAIRQLGERLMHVTILQMQQSLLGEDHTYIVQIAKNTQSLLTGYFQQLLGRQIQCSRSKFMKIGFLNEFNYVEETITLFNALEGFFRAYNRPENQAYIKELTKETFDDRLKPAL